jgi:hypothetical protein
MIAATYLKAPIAQAEVMLNLELLYRLRLIESRGIHGRARSI